MPAIIRWLYNVSENPTVLFSLLHDGNIFLLVTIVFAVNSDMADPQ